MAIVMAGILCEMAENIDWAPRLRAFRQSQRLTMKQIAAAIGVKVTDWQNYEYGKASPPESVLGALRKLGFGTTRHGPDVLSQPLIPVGFSNGRIPFAGVVPAGDWGDPLASEEFVEVAVEFEAPNHFAARVVGDSCYPALLQGDLTVWAADRTPQYGAIVIAERLEDRCCTVKELVYENGPALHPINPSSSPATSENGWEVVARLVGVIRNQDGARQTWRALPGESLKRRHLV